MAVGTIPATGAQRGPLKGLGGGVAEEAAAARVKMAVTGQPPREQADFEWPKRQHKAAYGGLFKSVKHVPHGVGTYRMMFSQFKMEPRLERELVNVTNRAVKVGIDEENERFVLRGKLPLDADIASVYDQISYRSPSENIGTGEYDAHENEKIRIISEKNANATAGVVFFLLSSKKNFCGGEKVTHFHSINIKLRGKFNIISLVAQLLDSALVLTRRKPGEIIFRTIIWNDFPQNFHRRTKITLL